METKRIILRPWRDSDAESLFKYASDPDVGPRADWTPHQSVEESLDIIRTVFHNDTNWAIELKSTGEAIGAIGYGPSCDCKLPARENEPDDRRLVAECDGRIVGVVWTRIMHEYGHISDNTPSLAISLYKE